MPPWRLSSFEFWVVIFFISVKQELPVKMLVIPNLATHFAKIKNHDKSSDKITDSHQDTYKNHLKILKTVSNSREKKCPAKNRTE